VADPRTAGLVPLSEAEGLTEGLARCVALAAGELAAEELGAEELGAEELGERAGDVATVGLVVGSTVEVAGLNVATDSIAPATRHTARMLASSGMTLPRAANGAKGPASRRSRFRRRCARSSRW
jgi:hypothetical protein